MMAELIIACEQGRDHDRDPLPFRLERAGRTISLGFFSRRPINPESSFSVLGCALRSEMPAPIMARSGTGAISFVAKRASVLWGWQALMECRWPRLRIRRPRT